MDALISTAREFCCWCKSKPGTESEEGQKAHLLLVRLYCDALKLAEPEKYDPDINPDRVNDKERKRVYARAAALPSQYYSSYFDPLEVPPEYHKIGDLADYVADIYRDLSGGLALIDAGHSAKAQWEMRFSSLAHWRRHASGAIRALHCWYVDRYKF
jgi:hypothetical protein